MLSWNLGNMVELSGTSSFPERTAFKRYLSALEPMTYPSIEAAIVKAIAALGIRIDFLSKPINGTAA